MEDGSSKKKKKFRMQVSKENTRVDYTWVVKTLIITFVLSISFNFVSSIVMSEVNIWFAMLILFLIIFVGILFDVIGVAVTTADETPFHSMAVHKVKGSKQAIKLVKAKDKVSNFCNDVVGDVCGIISGSASAVVVVYILNAYTYFNNVFISIVTTGIVASLTVGGKAIGKTIAISYSNNIVYMVSRILATFGFSREKKKSNARFG